MLEDLEALNERIYELYGRLYENGELLTKKQSDYIADRLFEQYKKEYEILKLNTEPDRATAQYRAEERGELLTPRSPCWFKRLFGQRKNKAAELIEREEQKTAEERFAVHLYWIVRQKSRTKNRRQKALKLRLKVRQG